MPKFRKKPVVIEAWKNPGKVAAVPRWVIDAASQDTSGRYHIKTLEGTMVAEVGDWIIKGVKDEVYPCKPDIFAATYEPVE